MKYEIKNKSDLVADIIIKVDAKEWQSAITKVYEQQKNKYEIQGWRKGKVPQKVIEQNYGNTVFWEDAITELANEGFRKAISENKSFDPIGSPNLSVDKVSDNGVELTITTDVIPPVKLAKYKGLTVEAPLLKFEDKMLEEELQKAQAHKTTDKPQENKVAENGDIVVIDFVGSVDGVPFEGGKAENHKLELGSKSFVDNFEDQLVGHKAGDKVKVSITFPKDYGAQALAGKKAVFDCEIKSVNVKEVPALDDAFAKSMGYDTLEAYKEDVKKQLEHEIEHHNHHAKEDAILEEIVKTTDVILPPVLIEQNLDHIMKDLQYRLAYQGINLEDYAKYTGTTVEKLKEDRRKDAEALTKTKLVLEALVRAENLTVSEAEAEEQLKEIAKMQEKSLEDVKKMFDERAMDRVYSDILMKKVNHFLLDNNKIVEKAEAKEKSASKKSSAQTKTADKPKKVAEKKTATKTAEKKTTKPATKTATKKTTK